METIILTLGVLAALLLYELWQAGKPKSHPTERRHLWRCLRTEYRDHIRRTGRSLTFRQWLTKMQGARVGRLYLTYNAEQDRFELHKLD